MKLLPVLEVWWVDAECDVPGWEVDEDSVGKRCPLVRSVGMLLEDNEHVVLLACTHSERDNNARFRIPASCVVKKTVLMEGSDVELDIYAQAI